jgi:hypothetical protein
LAKPITMVDGWPFTTCSACMAALPQTGKLRYNQATRHGFLSLQVAAVSPIPL